ncbi:MAG: thioredoxin family protein [Propionibacteriaceae bacterium]|nr:thioredoxin family protein [Propionibacteriaceae bacterium]
MKKYVGRGLIALALVVGVLLAANLAMGHRPRAPELHSQPLPSTTEATTTARPAPELTGIEAWLNSEPVTLAGLRGKVVLVDFWTYSCINCVRTQPYLNAWYERYRDAGFEIIGVHAPEFAFEKVPENVAKAVADAGIEYPVALDNDFATWRAYDNKYWPTRYLVDRSGSIVFTHHGEGAYEETEQHIRDLLQSTAPAVSATPDGQAHTGTSPEIHLGAERTFGYNGTPDLNPQLFDYTPAGELASHQWHLEGQWQVTGESITALSDGATLRIRFDARQLFLVAGGPPGSTVEVQGEPIPIEHSGLHRMVELPEFATGTLVELRFSAGVTAHALTFGG